MRKAADRLGFLVVVLILISACSGANSPVAPAINPAAPASPVVPPLVPGNTPPAGTYVFTDSPYPPSSYTRESRFVLSDDGRFALMFTDGEYRGTYRFSEETGFITFDWEGWSSAGPWGATGSFRDDVLIVRYNVIMQHTDFEDASYTRVP